VARALLALLLVLAGAAQAREPDALTALESCAAQLDPSLDVGYERIAARCPDLTAQLERSPWAPWLPPDWKQPDNELSAAGLRALHIALMSEAAAVPGTRTLHPANVRAVLERVTRPEPEQGGWWARFKRWLRALLAQQAQEDNGWLRRLLGDVSIDKAMVRLIVAVSIALLVVLALAVLVNELRVAGLLRRRPESSDRPAPGRAAPGGLKLSDVEAAEPGSQPGLLLELIAARLAAQDRLPPARAFTVRELIRRARLEDEAARTRLADLAAVSERVRYAAGAVAAPVREAAMHGGRELLAALETPAAAAGAA
jgi:hypothetical protein